MTQKNVDKLVREYISKRDLYRDFAFAMEAILGQLLTDIKYQSLSSREKEPKKLDEKIKRKKREEKKIYRNLREIEDLAGVRVVFYLESQKDAFLEVVQKEFDSKSLRIERKDRPGGYRSVHCIFSLDKSREKLPEYRRFKGLKCEIQLTSVLYHAWSEIEHDIIYKPNEDKKALDELGLGDLKEDFEKTMTSYIYPASNRLERHNEIYQNMLRGISIFKQIYNIENVLASSSNDQIFSILEIIGNFPHKKPDEVISVVESIVSKKPSKAVPVGSFGGEKYFGKTHKDVVIKGIELIKSVRYFSTERVLFVLADLIKSPDKEIKEKSIDTLKAVACFDYNLLTKSNAGYSYQGFVLDFMKKWSLAERLLNIDFVLTVVKELLSSSIEGSSWTDEKTLTMNFAQVNPTDFIKKIRRKTMNFVYNLYVKAFDAKVRLQLASVLEEVMRGPTNAAYSDTLKEMIEENTKYLASIYRKMVFDKSKNIIKENIAVTEEIEERLYYFAKPDKDRPSELIRLRQDILNDSFYNKVCPMIGGRAVYKNEKGYDKSKELRANDMQALITQISEKTSAEWRETLDILAKQKNVIEDWKLADFKRFLELLSSEKPEIADKLLETAFKEKSALVIFSESFLMGFQNKQKFDLWDKYVKLIAKKRNVHLTGGICVSLIANEEEKPLKKLRPIELTILEEIVYRKGIFKFLQTKKKDNFNGYLHDVVFSALASNFKQCPGKIERFIKEEIESNSEYAYIYYYKLSFITLWKWIDLSLLSKSFEKYLLNKIIEAPDLDWHLQEFLFELCKKDFACIMNIFEKRIALYIKLKKNDKTRGWKRMMKRKEFEAIPYHFNPDLQKLILEHKDFSRTMQKWIGKMNLTWSNYNWEVSRFLDQIRADKQKVLSNIVAKGNDRDLLRVAYVMEGIDRADFELCMQIVGRTNNERIHKKIGSIMYATGMTSGEYGIADAYKGKIEMFQKYKTSKNKRIKKFALEMIGYLQKDEEDERKRVAEEIQLRKIDFEG